MVAGQFRNLYVALAYVWIPLLSCTYRFQYGIEFNAVLYDVALAGVVLLAMAFFVLGERADILRFRNVIILCAILVVFLNIKYLLGLVSGNGFVHFYSYPFFMEIKPLYYIICCVIICSIFGPPDLKFFVTCGSIFSFLIILDTVVKFALFGHYQRPTVASESNYDGFLVLISLIALFALEPKNFLRLFMLFAVATLLTSSKTGIGSFVVLSAIWFLRVGRLRYMLPLLVIAGIGALALFQRMQAVSGFEDLDRVIMWLSFINLMGEASAMEILFGFLPGVPIAMSNTSLQWFIGHQGDKIGIDGLHAFTFHGMHLRLILTWGVLPTIAVWWALLAKIRFNRVYFMLFTLIFLQGFSMGVIYLSVVSGSLILFTVAYIQSGRRSTHSMQYSVARPALA